MNGNATLSSSLSDFTYGLLPLFYLVPPHHTYFKEIEDIPDYVQQVIPYFFLLIFIEAAILWWNRSTVIRFNDVIGSVTGGIVLQLSKAVLFRGLELPWDSPITWWVCFLTYDFMFYWFHRATHEINIFWAFHQMHHSSEEFNLSTALRQSAFQQCISWIFNLPLALFIPPTQFIVHVQFNLLYQFWIHTEVIDRLGPLEYILNTPSHHRVHHGRNRYCIDKNYSAVFIIWDVMFGTFSPESDKVYYGLVHPVRTFNPITLQFFHFVHVLKSAWKANGLINKLSVLFKGPGWYPGTNRLGNPEDIPVVPVDIKPYNKAVSLWIHFYCIFHFLLTNIVTVLLGAKQQQQEMSYITAVVISFFLLFCLTNIGMIYDVNSLAPSLEVVRLLMLLVTDHLFRPYVFTNDLMPAPPSASSRKSSLAIQFVDNHFVDSYEPTIENTFEKTLSHKGQDYLIQVVDTAGQDEYSIFPRSYTMDIHGYVLLYSVTSMKSFDTVKVIHDKLLDQLGSGKIPLVLVGNKTDLHLQRVVTSEMGRKLAAEWNASFVEASAKQNEGVEDVFQKILQQTEQSYGNDTDGGCVIL